MVHNLNEQQIKSGVRDGSIPSAVADTGATSSVGTTRDRKNHAFLPTGRQSNKAFHMPNGTVEAATEIDELHHDVRHPAKDIHIVPGIERDSLLSIPKFADANYFAIFDKDELNIYDANKTKVTVSRGAILRGWRCTETNLWRVPLIPHVINNNTDTILCDRPPTEFLPQRPPPTDAVFNVYELKTQPELVRYHHAAAGFPTKPTWLKAIKNKQFASWPGLTADAVIKHFPESEETHKGHGRKTRSGLRSTKTTSTTDDNDDDDIARTDFPRPASKQKSIFITVYDLEDEAQLKMYTDQTGKFPKKSSRGHQYIMVLIEMDSNAILVAAMKNRTSGEMIRAYQELVDRLRGAGVRPKLHLLDNECSAEFKERIKFNDMKYQLVPPHDHRRNIAETAIKVFKAHFISILCGCDKSFPLHLWDRLLPQAEHTLNMLRTSTMTPTISAYAHLWGQHDYNANPFAPLGCKVEAHVTPGVRETWAPHTASGYYIGNAWEHYRCHEVYIIDTKSVRTCLTVFFKHKYLTMPTITPADALIRAADYLTDAISGLLPTHTVTADAVDQLMEIYKQQARDSIDAATAQRVLRERARAQRVLNEQAEPVTVSPLFEAEGSSPTAPPPSAIPQITQDDDHDSPPASNTRQQRENRTLTQDFMLQCMEIPGYKAPFTPQQAASRKYPLQFLCDLAYAVLDDETGDLLEYRHLMKHPKYKDVWTKSFSKEIVRLATTTETIVFIKKDDIPNTRRGDETYARIVCNFRESKKDKYRTRITIGGNLINFPDDCGTPTADLLTVKLLLNSIISTPNAKFMTLDLKDFYLMTPMKRYEYFRMKLELFPQDVIDLYDLRNKVDDNGNVHCEVRRGMYGLPQAGIIAQELLQERLAEAGYTQSKITPGYWKHKWRPISFTLVVDDFGVKYIGKEHVLHLIQILREHYEVEEDWGGTRYVGITLDWDYKQHEVHLSMPEYVERALARFGHPSPDKPQHQPHPHTIPTYGATVQYAKPEDTSRRLSPSEKKFIQEVTGVFLYYGRAVDSTMLTALSAIASAQAEPTEDTMTRCKQFLDYAATHQDAIITYKKSDMVLVVHSDASYLSEPKARSRAGGHFFLSSDTADPENNGAVLNLAQLIKAVMSSAAEAELGALYINACEAIPQRQVLDEMGHKQPPTPMQTDNTTALGVVNNNIQPCRTKAMDMRFHWLRCRESQQQFRYFWRPGHTNRADYWTKHHCAAHHTQKRPEILTPKSVLDALRASVKRTPISRTPMQPTCKPTGRAPVAAAA